MLDHILLPIRSGLDFIEEIIRGSVVSNVPLATEVARYTSKDGGKRIRPAVFLLSAKLCGASEHSLYSLAAAMELIHTASLLHDDVIDEALMRRGKQSARAKWGNQISVLVGDFIWCRAIKLLLENSSDRLYSIVASAVAETTEGELLEITRQNDHTLDVETYLKIIGGKTAALFSACGQCGAVVAQLNDPFEGALKSYGYNLGMSFQLVDDILDYTSQEKCLGKFPGTDLKEGKLTMPLIVALESASEEQRKLVRSALISGGQNKEDLDRVMDVIKVGGGISKAEDFAREYSEKAKAQLAIFKPSIERDALAALADYVVVRNE